MTPYERIAILQRLTHDRALAEKHVPCSAYKSCIGIRDEDDKRCQGCPITGATREPWQDRFLFHLASYHRVMEAANAVGRNGKTVYAERRSNPTFAAKWAEIMGT